MAQISIRIDDNIKAEAESLFSELGINMTTAFNMFIRQTLRQRAIPFEITANIDPFYSASNMKVLRKNIEEANEGKLTEHDLIED